MFELDGKIALVTGGSRGLGLQIATAFAERGATVVISSRKQEACVAAAERIADATGAQVTPIGCHVGQWDQCDQLLEQVYDRLGRLDDERRPLRVHPRADGLEPRAGRRSRAGRCADARIRCRHGG